MRLDAGAQNGTSQAKTKRIFNISIRLYESIGVEVGPDLNNMEAIPFRSSANPMDNLNENLPATVHSQLARDWVRIHAPKLDTSRLNSATLPLRRIDNWVYGIDPLR